MTNYNYKKAILTTFLALPLLTSAIGAIPNAYGGTVINVDLNPPDYRGDNDSVFALWQGFSICLFSNGDLELNGNAVLPVNGFSVEPNIFNAVETSGELFPEADTVLEFLAPSLFSVTVQNIVDDHTTKNLRVQVLTCSFNDAIPAIVSDVVAEDNDLEVPVIQDGEPAIRVDQIGPELFLIHVTYDFIIEPNPDVEGFLLSIEDTSLIGLIVDTVSFSEDIPVHIDIKPQSCPNPINTNSRGVVPVAILGSSNLDVNQIDVSTVQLEGVSPVKHNIEDVATPHTPDTTVVDPNDCTIEGPDGFDDLTLKFDTQTFVAALGPISKVQVIQVELTGALLDGTPFESYDTIIIK